MTDLPVDENTEAAAADAAAGTTTTTPFQKIDPITALQEGVDGLSLAMFEGLRGLRDAVAPDSGNLGNAANNGEQEGGIVNDVEELWLSYCNRDPDVVAMVDESKFNPGGKGFKKREEFIKWHSTVEQEKDTELVEKLAKAVLEKSDQIDQAVERLPGMHRNREQQMAYLQQLIEENAKAMDALTNEYERARAIRDKCRDYVLENTSAALGISDQ